MFSLTTKEYQKKYYQTHPEQYEKQKQRARVSSYLRSVEVRKTRRANRPPFCQKCGAQASSKTQRFCGNCGAQLPSAKS